MEHREIQLADCSGQRAANDRGQNLRSQSLRGQNLRTSEVRASEVRVQKSTRHYALNTRPFHNFGFGIADCGLMRGKRRKAQGTRQNSEVRIQNPGGMEDWNNGK